MLLIFAFLLGGVVAGRLLSGRRLRFVPPLVTATIWALLFLLGLEVGADPTVRSGLATLGRTACLLFAGSVAGSILCARLLEFWLRRRTAVARCEVDAIPEAELGPDHEAGVAPDLNSDFNPDTVASSWHALRGSAVIVGFFAVGCSVGAWRLLTFDAIGSQASTWVLRALMALVGVTLGADRTLVGRIRRLDPRLALLPVATAVGTLAGAALAGILLGGVSLADRLAVGAGFGYYSLSSIFIADLRSVELGTVALLCNILRELFTLLFAPLVARRFGPLAAVSIGGATSFDTTLPVITRAAGRPYVVVSIFHGCVLDFCVPFLVTLFCSL